MGFLILEFLKIVTLVLGFLTVILVGNGYSKPFYNAHEAELLAGDDAELQNSTECEELQEKINREIHELEKEFFLKPRSEEDRLKFLLQIENKEKILQGPTCHVQKHAIQDELVFSMVIIVWILSILVFVLTLIILKYPNIQKAIDVWFHVVAGLILFIMAILWFMSVSERTFDYGADVNRKEELNNKMFKCGSDKDCLMKLEIERLKGDQKNSTGQDKYGDINMIYLNEFRGSLKVRCGKFPDGKASEECEETWKKIFDNVSDLRVDFKAEETFALVLIAGIVILINALLYFGIAVLAVIIYKPKEGQQSIQHEDEYDAEINPPPKEDVNFGQFEREPEPEPEYHHYPQPEEVTQDQILEQQIPNLSLNQIPSWSEFQVQR